MRNFVLIRSTAVALTALVSAAGDLGHAAALGDGTAPTARGLGRDGRCQAQIRRQAAGLAAKVDPVCWRVGPIAIGMARGDVERLLGPADSQTDASDGEARPIADQSAIYVFPRALAADAARRPATALHFRLLYLIYQGGRVVRISTDQTYALSTSRCGPSRSDSTAESGASDPAPTDFQPFMSVDGIRLGDSLGALQRRLGHATAVSSAADFYAYTPAPLSFHVEAGEAGGRPEVLGFAIGSDDRTIFLGQTARIRLERDPVSCRFTGYTLLSR